MKRTSTRTARLLSGLGLLAVLTGATWMPTAHAIPGDGAGSDTPGASASVSPRSLTAGSVISFRITGFPAGEIVNVKVDDGKFCSASGVHGACVVHQQRVSASGSVSGSFALPADLLPGQHWLRFLASKDLGADANGQPLGTKGYTLRGGANFTIVAGARSGSTPRDTTSGATTGPSTTTGSLAQAPGAPSTTAAAGVTASTAPGGSQTTASAVATPGQAIVVKPSADQSSAAPTPPAAPVTAAPDSVGMAQAAAASDEQPVPWLGIGAGLSLLVAAVALQFIRRRRG